MLTPQEIQTKKFEKAVFGGYDMGMVDEFLDLVYADYSALYKETAVLKSKMKVLVDKIDEYRSVDDAMRKALLSAQNMASEMVADAKKKSEALTENARIEAESRILQYKQEADMEQARLRAAKEEASAFISETINRYKSGLARLEEIGGAQNFEMPDALAEGKLFEMQLPEEVAPELPEEEPSGKLRAEQAFQASSDRGIAASPEEEDTVEIETKRFREPMRMSSKREEEADQAEEEGVTPRPKFKFENLQFGKEYEEEIGGRKRK